MPPPRGNTSKRAVAVLASTSYLLARAQIAAPSIQSVAMSSSPPPAPPAPAPAPATVEMDSSSSSERYSYNPTLTWNPKVEEYFIKAYGPHHFAKISKALTRPSSYSCIRVNTLKSTSDAVIEKLGNILREERLANGSSGHVSIDGTNSASTGGDGHVYRRGSSEESCPNPSLNVDNWTKNGSFREISMEVLQNPPIYKCQLSGMDNVVFVEGSGPRTHHYHDTNDQPVKELIVSRKCAEAVLRGAQVFVPGVLACSSHVEKGDKVAVSVAIEQIGSENEWSVGITRGTILHGLPTDPQYFERRGLYVGLGTAILSRAGIFRASKGIAVDMTDRVYQLPSFHDVLEGEIFLQNLPSIVAARVLDPQEGERILDMCAAPGGKTTAIAILMKDKGEVIAVDRSHNKVMDILSLASEMGLSCISAFRLDALKAVHKIEEEIDVDAKDSNKESLCNINNISDSASFIKDSLCNTSGDDHNLNLPLKKSGNNSRRKNGPGRNNCVGSRVEKSKGFLPHTFDRVLLDAPCSALGLRPRLFAGEETIESLRNHARYQRRMLDQAVQLVRPGGVVVYSTCTINPGENEALVRYALDTYKFLSLAPQHPRIGGPGLVGQVELFDGARIEKWLTPGESELVQRFDPSSPLDTIGFFVAKFNVGQDS